MRDWEKNLWRVYNPMRERPFWRDPPPSRPKGDYGEINPPSSLPKRDFGGINWTL